MPLIKPAYLWWLSCQAYRKRIPFLPRLLKTVNFLMFHAILPYEAQIEKDIRLEHCGLGVVVHPNVTLGHRVQIWQHVTLATQTDPKDPHRIVIEEDVMIGAGAVVITRPNQGLIIGKGAKIGANAVVTHDVPPGVTVVGAPARPLPSRNEPQHE